MSNLPVVLNSENVRNNGKKPNFKLNLFERFIGFLSPEMSLKRIKSRALSEILVREYAAAGRGARLKESFKYAHSTSANNEIRTAHAMLLMRSRDMVRNNSYASRAVTSIASNAVGIGITAQIMKNGEPDNRIQELWDNFTLSKDFDAEGKLNFYAMQELAMKEIVEAGEVFLRKFPKSSKSKFPIEIKLLESEFLDSAKYDGIYYGDGSMTAQGICFNKRGRPTDYWLFPHHPGDIAYPGYVSDKVPAAEIAHCFRSDRAQQARGISWFAPVLIDMNDLGEFQDAELMRRKIAACFTAFIHDIDASFVDQNIPNQKKLIDKLEPATIETLPPGKTITFANPPVSNGYGEFSSEVLKKIAVGLGVSYEVLSGDLSRVNFSSGRMGWLEFQRNLEVWRWNMLIPNICEPVFKWFLDAIELKYGIDIKGITAEWTPPGREMIDPVKEVEADISAVRAGFKTIDEVHRERGYNSDKIFKKYAHNNRIIDKYGLVLDSDPRITLIKGETSTKSSDESNNGKEKKGDKEK